MHEFFEHKAKFSRKLSTSEEFQTLANNASTLEGSGVIQVLDELSAKNPTLRFDSVNITDFFEDLGPIYIFEGKTTVDTAKRPDRVSREDRNGRVVATMEWVDGKIKKKAFAVVMAEGLNIKFGTATSYMNWIAEDYLVERGNSLVFREHHLSPLQDLTNPPQKEAFDSFIVDTGLFSQ